MDAGGVAARPAEQPTTRPALGPWPALEGLRGVAIVAVVVGHLGEFLYQDNRDAQQLLLPGGFLGVDLFLVLSGFLITALLLREVDRTGGIRLGRFWVRRLTRLYPSLVVFLLSYLVFSAVTGSPYGFGTQLRVSGLALVFLSNWQFVMGLRPLVDVPVDLSHLWSLAVEGQFYLLWPPVILLLHRVVRRTGAIVLALVGLTVAVALLRSWEYARYGDWILVYTRTDARFDTFAVGAIVAVLWERGAFTPDRTPLVRLVSWVGFIGLCGSFLFLETPTAGTGGPTAEFLFRGGFTVVSIAGAATIAGAIDVRSLLARMLSWSPLRLAGRASYSIYLFHLPVFIWAHNRWPDSLAAATTMALLGTLVTGGACYLAVERPVLRRRGRA